MKSCKLSFVNTRIRLNQIIKLLPTLLILAALAACSGGDFSGASEGTGTVNINFAGADSRSTKKIPYPPYLAEPEEQAMLEYKIVLNGNGRMRVYETGKGVTSYTVTVPVGNWEIEIRAYVRITGSFLYAKGKNSVDVKAEERNHVTVEMMKAFYQIGETGPGGGIIFHADPGGYIDPGTGEIFHYFEVAKEDVVLLSNTTNITNGLTWSSPNSSYIDITGTKENAGAGRNNTALILAADPYAPAALACKDYRVPGFPQTDWFLPSKEELHELDDWWFYLGSSVSDSEGFTPLMGNYWSSSQYPNDVHESAYYWIFSTAGQSHWEPAKKTISYSVRPIRAFASEQ